MKIGNKTLGKRTYIIAEFGVNHNGSLKRAKEGIEKASQAGADAIKFQTYTADELVVKGTPKFWDWGGDKDKESQYDAYKAIGGFPYSKYPDLIKHCKKHNIEFLSTPFSFEGADFLNSLGMKAFKVSSSDMSHIPYLKHIAKYKKPILLSTGASTLEEIKEAVNTIREVHSDIVVMHCTLSYPTSSQDANLDVIGLLKEEFPDLVIGLSDHTLGAFTPIIGSAIGAQVVEKHFTVDKTLPESADHWLSVDPQELEQIVNFTRYAEVLRGNRTKKILDCESATRKYDKRSIVSNKNIRAGQIITKSMITYKRPGTGIEPRDYKKVIGMKAKKTIKEDTTLQWKMISS